jgi:hypothetical protein
MIEQRMKDMSRAHLRRLRVGGGIRVQRNYPPTINSAPEAEFARQVMAASWVPSNVQAQEPTMGAEDFSYMLQAKPGATPSSPTATATTASWAMAAARACCTTPATTSTTRCCRWGPLLGAVGRSLVCQERFFKYSLKPFNKRFRPISYANRRAAISSRPSKTRLSTSSNCSDMLGAIFQPGAAGHHAARLGATVVAHMGHHALYCAGDGVGTTTGECVAGVGGERADIAGGYAQPAVPDSSARSMMPWPGRIRPPRNRPLASMASTVTAVPTITTTIGRAAPCASNGARRQSWPPSDLRPAVPGDRSHCSHQPRRRWPPPSWPTRPTAPFGLPPGV